MCVYKNWSKGLRVFVYVCIYCRIFGTYVCLTSNYCTVQSVVYKPSMFLIISFYVTIKIQYIKTTSVLRTRINVISVFMCMYCTL